MRLQWPRWYLSYVPANSHEFAGFRWIMVSWNPITTEWASRSALLIISDNMGACGVGGRGGSPISLRQREGEISQQKINWFVVEFFFWPNVERTHEYCRVLVAVDGNRPAPIKLSTPDYMNTVADTCMYRVIYPTILVFVGNLVLMIYVYLHWINL